MKQKKGLTKDDCFNALEKKYPKAMKQFQEWAPKFYVHPYAMQLGLWIIFLTENYPDYDWSVDSTYNLKTGMEQMFDEIEKTLK